MLSLAFFSIVGSLLFFDFGGGAPQLGPDQETQRSRCVELQNCAGFIRATSLEDDGSIELHEPYSTNAVLAASTKTLSSVIEAFNIPKHQPVEPQLVEDAVCPCAKAGRATQLSVVADDGRYAGNLAVIVQHVLFDHDCVMVTMVQS